MAARTARSRSDRAGPGRGLLGPGAGRLDEPVVAHAGRARGHTCHAAEAAVEVGGSLRGELGTVQRLGDEVDPATGRVHLLAPQLVGRAGGQAEAAVDAVRRGRPQLAGGIQRAGHRLAAARAAPLRRLRGAVPPGHRCHQIPPAKRPGAIRCPGSNWSLTARISDSPGTGPHMSASSRTARGAWTTTALASTGGLSGTGAEAGLASAAPRARASRSAATNPATAAGWAPAPSAT